MQILSHLFYRGDCCEFYENHTKDQPRGQETAKILLCRVDFRGWAVSKEFAAIAANIVMRRRQMWGVYNHVQVHSAYVQDIMELDSLGAKDFLNAALACGECDSIRQVLWFKRLRRMIKGRQASSSAETIGFGFI